MDRAENFRIIDLGSALSPSDSAFIVNMSSTLRQRDWYGWDEDPKYEKTYEYIYNHRLYADIDDFYMILQSEARSGYADITFKNRSEDAVPFLREVIDNITSFGYDAYEYYNFWIRTWNRHYGA
jgi:hypothetical protein